MSNSHPSHACPVDLHYPEPKLPSLDLAAITARGGRIRRRRKLTQAAAVLAASVATGSVIAGTRGFTISLFPSQSGPAAALSAGPIDAQVAEDPPANGKLTLISRWPRNWATVAWATRRGDVCSASFSGTPRQGGLAGNVDCPRWDRSEVPGSGSNAFSPLVPDGALASSAAPGTAWPVLGLTSPRAVRVVLSASGKDVSATVVSVPIGTGKAVGVFVAWIQVPGNSSSSGDVTSETAYDQIGHIIAHVSNPP